MNSKTIQSVCPKCGSTCNDVGAGESSTFATAALVKGNPSDRSAAIELVAMMLDAADSVLLAGIGCLDMDSQVAAWQLADRLHGSIDISLSRTDRAKLFSLAKYGKVTSTYGEVSQRADVLICWFSDPVADANCVWKLMTEARRSEIKVVVVDESETETAKKADHFLHVSRDQAESLISTVRGLCQGNTTRNRADTMTEPQWDMARKLHDWMTAAKYGALLFPHGNRDSDLDLETESLMLLVRELNATVPFVAQSIASDNRGGASYVLASMAGFSSAINFNRGFPRYLDLEYSANTMLRRGHCDLAIAFTSPDTTDNDVALLDHRQANIQLIEIGVGCCHRSCSKDNAGTPRSSQAEIFVPVVACGEQGKARFLRGDGAMLETSAQPEDQSLSCERMLLELLSKVKD